MKLIVRLTLCSLLSALCSAAEPPVPPPANATAAQWAAYNNAVAAWNQKAAALRQEQRDQRLLDLIEQQNRLQALELLRKQGKLPK